MKKIIPKKFAGLDLREGTLEITIKKNKIQWNNGQSHNLGSFSSNEGSILLIKDSDNKLKFFHVILGKGRTNVEVDVSNLKNDERHYIVATWSLKNKRIILYIDGKEVARTSIKY